MNPRTVVAGGLIAALVIGLFVWTASSPTRPKSQPPQKTGSVLANTEPAQSVRPTEIDPSSVASVFGVVVDTSGEPVDGGLLILHCLPRGADRSAPIPGGVVRLEADGTFVGPSCTGLVCAEFRHPTMIARDPWELHEGANELVATLLDRRDGTVVDAGGQPIAGARITVRPAPGENLPTAVPPFASSVTNSDVDGAFAFARLERPPCDACGEHNGACQPDDLRDLPVYHSLVVSAQAQGFRPGQITVDLDDTDPWTVVLDTPAPPIAGTLADPRGDRYARVNILAVSEQRPTEYHRARVGDDGHFELTELGDGPHELRAVQDGIELLRKPGVVAGETVELVGERPASGVDLELVIVDENGSPLSGVRVTGGPFIGQQSDPQGVLQAGDVLPGHYTFRVRTPALRRQRFEVDVASGRENRHTLELSTRG